MNHGLPAGTFEQIIACLSRFPEIEKVVLFGSRALGSYRRGSDIDLAVWLHPDGGQGIGAISLALDELPTPYLFDVVLYSDISHAPLKTHIDDHGLQIYP